LQIHRPTRWPQPDQSERLLVRFVGGTWKHGVTHTHTCTVPTLEFVIFSGGYPFQVVFLGLQSCHVDIFDRFHGKTTFTFLLILMFISTKLSEMEWIWLKGTRTFNPYKWMDITIEM
jgi:hypothetical protein